MPGGGNLKANVLLALLQVERKVCIEVFWEISMEKVCLGILYYNETTDKDFGTFICELFICSPIQQILSLYATIQSTSIKRT